MVVGDHDSHHLALGHEKMATAFVCVGCWLLALDAFARGRSDLGLLFGGPSLLLGRGAFMDIRVLLLRVFVTSVLEEQFSIVSTYYGKWKLVVAKVPSARCVRLSVAGRLLPLRTESLCSSWIMFSSWVKGTQLFFSLRYRGFVSLRGVVMPNLGSASSLDMMLAFNPSTYATVTDPNRSWWQVGLSAREMDSLTTVLPPLKRSKNLSFQTRCPPEAWTAFPHNNPRLPHRRTLPR